MEQKPKLFLRYAASLFVLGLILIAALFNAFRRWIAFLKYGGEWINYEKDEKTTIQDIYNQLKNKKHELQD
jgi:hypothetical protein